MKPTHAIALLTFRPDPSQVAFYESFAALGYAVFVFVDDNAFSLPETSRVRYIKIEENDCLARGYVLLNPMISMGKRGLSSAWEKALFFFGHLDRQFDHVWFFEDDVFIPDVQLISRMDQRHPDADLLCEGNRINHFGELNSWDWWRWVPKSILPLPWASSMVCAVRMSGRLLKQLDRLISETAQQMEQLHIRAIQQKLPRKFLFIEFLFNTVALHGRFKVELPAELSRVLFHKKWTADELDGEHIYHPVKQVAAYDALRAQLQARHRQGG